jgi:hypothetical protein
MESSHSNRNDLWPGQEPGDQPASKEPSWGEGSASALESLKQREQRREAGHSPRQRDVQHPQAGEGMAAGS